MGGWLAASSSSPCARVHCFPKTRGGAPAAAPAAKVESRPTRRPASWKTCWLVRPAAASRPGMVARLAESGLRCEVPRERGGRGEEQTVLAEESRQLAGERSRGPVAVPARGALHLTTALTAPHMFPLRPGRRLSRAGASRGPSRPWCDLKKGLVV